MMGVARKLKFVMTMSLLLGLSGCDESPHDQFKQISDGKKAQLTKFLESKQSRLTSYKATVTEETDVDRRPTVSHIGLIKFSYPVTKPVGEFETQGLDSAVAQFEFSTKEKKWSYKQSFLELGGTVLYEKDRLLTFQEVAAAFNK